MIKALHDIVIIERDKYDGLLVVDEKMCHGTVISVGPGRWKASVRDIQPGGKVHENWYPTCLKEGQKVCFSLDKGEQHEIEGKKVVVMREDDIACVIEDDESEVLIDPGWAVEDYTPKSSMTVRLPTAFGVK